MTDTAQKSGASNLTAQVVVSNVVEFVWPVNSDRILDSKYLACDERHSGGGVRKMYVHVPQFLAEHPLSHYHRFYKVKPMEDDRLQVKAAQPYCKHKATKIAHRPGRHTNSMVEENPQEAALLDIECLGSFARLSIGKLP